MAMESFLDNDIKFLKGVGGLRGELLERELGIRTMRDLLYYFPHRYIDRTVFHKIADITPDTTSHIQFRARIDGFSYHGNGPKKRLVATVSDSSGSAELLWFQGAKWMEKRLESGREYIIFGKPSFYRDELSMIHPEMELAAAVRTRSAAAVEGVYSTTEKLSAISLGSKGIFGLVCNLWQAAESHIAETLPHSIMESNGLIPLKQALYDIHFPKNEQRLQAAQYRLKFEELFGIQLAILSERSARTARNDGFFFSKVGDIFSGFYDNHLPFELTGAQKRVIREIRADTVTGHQMNRLLQGDVGSGKTLVAVMSMLLAADNGYQSAMMVPTEILARQHYATVASLLGQMEVGVATLTGTTKKKERDDILERLKAGEIDILIGTHALIEERVEFGNLGFVVIDEQHRFGVEQRARLWTKNNRAPHILVMTATPIPRTLAMTMYGDLDISVIDELPPGRKPIQTVHYYDSARLKLLGFIKKEIALGRQIYIVFPLIQESKTMDYKNLDEGFESICREFPGPEFVVAVVHGRMKAADKELNMKLFKDGAAHIMVATSVIEVGVDVPNASVMVIESAERFGLSQLHQLRGRVGRGADQSYCILMSGDKLSREGRARLKAMTESSDGFVLAELDLKLRGAGDINGTQQSGLAFDLKIANITKDTHIIELVRSLAGKVLESDHSLDMEENMLLKRLRARYFKRQETDFSMIS